MLKSAMLFAAEASMRMLPRMRRGNSTLFDLAIREEVRPRAGSQGIKPDSDDTFPIQIASSTAAYAGLVRPLGSGSGSGGPQTTKARVHGRGNRRSSCARERRPISPDHCRRI